MKESIQIVNEYYDSISKEILENWYGLSETRYAKLGQYYKAMVLNPMKRKFYKYNWQQRILPMVKLMASLPKRNTPWRILDAGCGVGTETILWASLRNDVEVTGIELSRDRFETAQARLKTRYEKNEVKLNVNFLQGNVFDLLASGSYDLIWTMEAISHIHPAEDFLSAAYNSLEPGGHLIISDSHLLNPKMQWRIIKLRRKSPKYIQKLLVDGSSIGYADERLFAVPFLKKLMRNAGFTDVRSQLSIFFPPGLARYKYVFSLLVAIDKVLGRVPILRLIGGIYTISGKKTT